MVAVADARYSHNFDIRRLVRIKLTAAITSLSTQGKTIINPRFFPAISGDEEESSAPGQYNRGESCVPPGATACATRSGLSAGLIFLTEYIQERIGTF